MDEFSEIWPRSGMMRGGIAYPLQPLAPLTVETGSGLLPTPTRHIHKELGYPAEFNRNTLGLGAVVKMWPTPTLHGMHNRAGISKKAGDGLSTAVKRMWPTPNAGDDRDRGCMKMPSIQRRARLGKQLNLSMVVDPDSGSLNADWVEWLMGFPVGWTQVSGFKSQKEYRAPPKVRKTEP
jgi:DNA (cytosine-5)-methyltransferase 1